MKILINLINARYDKQENKANKYANLDIFEFTYLIFAKFFNFLR